MNLHHGDCLEVMAGMDAESVDAIVTDPPYDLLSASRNGSPRRNLGKPGNPFARYDRGGAAGGFMGKAWDGTGIAFRPETWATALRVAKPSAYLLAFGGTRTVHRMTCAIEDAGWIIRDMLVWAYASGFPKGRANLKPAWEPIVMARKPGPLRMLAIDECRIPFESSLDAAAAAAAIGFDTTPGVFVAGKSRQEYVDAIPTSGGRWPANVILTDPIFDGGWEGVVGGGWQESTSVPGAWQPRGAFPIDNPTPTIYGDSGTYSRFFLIPKADRTDREPVLGGLAKRIVKTQGKAEGWTQDANGGHSTGDNRVPRANVHPTVKPVDLMRHLVRLVVPTGGIVLDPFLGSGTTAIAAEMEGFEWIGIEKEAEYVAIAEARLNGTQRGLGLTS